MCAMSRLNLVTFRFSVGCRGATGIVTKWCDLPPFSISHLHWVMWLSAALCDLSLPLVVIGSIVFYFFFRIFFNIFVIECIYKSLHIKNQCERIFGVWPLSFTEARTSAFFGYRHTGCLWAYGVQPQKRLTFCWPGGRGWKRQQNEALHIAAQHGYADVCKVRGLNVSGQIHLNHSEIVDG